MVVPNRAPANGFVKVVRKIYNPLGFAKGYNFILWFIFGGALIGFVAARLMFLDVEGILCGNGPQRASPGECYYFLRGIPRYGIVLHLAGILPAGFLAVFQFLPVIRHKVLHRISVYVIILLSFVGVAGAIMIARHGLGGGLEAQSAAGVSSIIFVSCKIIAFYNIKKLQIEQHRAWMLQAWVILRLISFVMALIIGRSGSDYYIARPCYLVDNMFGGNRIRVEAYYPACRAYYSGSDLNVIVPIHADFTSQRPDEAGSALYSSFGAGAFPALVIHIIGTELYLRLTPAESERLRRVSYQRQLEAGMKNPGNGGWTVQRLGDAEPWFAEQSLAREKQAKVASDVREDSSSDDPETQSSTYQ